MKQYIDYKAIANSNLSYEGMYSTADNIIVIAKEDKNANNENKKIFVTPDSEKSLEVKYYLIRENSQSAKEGDYQVINQEAADKLIYGLPILTIQQEAEIKPEPTSKVDKPKSSPVSPSTSEKHFDDKHQQTDAPEQTTYWGNAKKSITEKAKKWNRKDLGLLAGGIAVAGITLFAAYKYLANPVSSASENLPKPK